MEGPSDAVKVCPTIALYGMRTYAEFGIGLLMPHARLCRLPWWGRDGAGVRSHVVGITLAAPQSVSMNASKVSGAV